jgi:tetratricopeptide (TPR) repeat protein
MRVHIISISWGMRNHVPSIAKALGKAIEKGILVFACASNSGANDPITFPARLQGIFCIGSADGKGAQSIFNPPSEDEETYSALGEAVQGACPANLSQEPGYNATEGTIRRDGTSISTPIAAGIAALLIDYTWQFMDGKGAQTYENMRKLFIEMSKSTVRKDYRYLAPWNLFEQPNDPKSYISAVLSAPAGKISASLDLEAFDRLVSTGYLAIAYRDQGMFAHAVKLGQEVLEGMTKLRGEDDPYTLWVMGHLAVIYWRQGEARKAARLGEQVLQKRIGVLGADHYDTVLTKGYLALIYQDLGRLDKTVKLGEEALTGFRRLKGEEDPETLQAMGYLALAYMKLGRWAHAIKLGERLLEIDTKLLGREHPDTRFVMQNLAIAYRNLGQTRNASNVSATSTTSGGGYAPFGSPHSRYQQAQQAQPTLNLLDRLVPAMSLADNQRPYQAHNQPSEPAAPKEFQALSIDRPDPYVPSTKSPPPLPPRHPVMRSETPGSRMSVMTPDRNLLLPSAPSSNLDTLSRSSIFDMPPETSGSPRSVTSAFPEDWHPKLSWAVPNPPTKAVFRRIGETPATDWNVVGVIVNKPNTRVLFISCHDSDPTIFSIKLCTSSGVLLRHKTLDTEGRTQTFWACFSEDGNYLAIYFRNQVEVFHTRQVEQIDSIALPRDGNFNPSSITIAFRRNTINLAVSIDRPGKEYNVSLAVQRIPQASGTRAVRIVSTTFLDTVQLKYVANGTRLFVIGKDVSPTDSGSSSQPGHCRGHCWDVQTGTFLSSFLIGPKPSFRDGPVYNTVVCGETCIAVRIRYEGGNHESGLYVFNPEGRSMPPYNGPRCLDAGIDGGIISLKREKAITFWAGGTQIYSVGRIEDDEMPSFRELKAFLVSERQVTLICDDERFIMLQRD